jgi:hypothetical protein
MMQLDKEIYDLIILYEEGDLSGEEQAAVEQKLATDETYRRHLAYYRSFKKTMDGAAERNLKKQLREWHSEPMLPEEKQLAERLMRQDRRRLFWRRSIWWFLAPLAFVALAFFLFRMIDQIPERPETEPPRPVASDERPSEERMAGGADIKEDSLLFRILSVDDEQAVEIRRETRPVRIVRHADPYPAYLLYENTLRLYHQDQGAFDGSRMQWVEVREPSDVRQYLQWQGRWYPLMLSTNRLALGEEAREGILQYLNAVR